MADDKSASNAAVPASGRSVSDASSVLASNPLVKRVLETYKLRRAKAAAASTKTAAAAAAASNNTNIAGDAKSEWFIQPEHAIGVIQTSDTGKWVTETFDFSGASALHERINSMLEEWLPALAQDFKPPPAAIETEAATPTPIASASGTAASTTASGDTKTGAGNDPAAASAGQSELPRGLTHNPVDDIDRTQLLYDICAVEHAAGNPIATNNFAILFTVVPDRYPLARNPPPNVEELLAFAAGKGCAMAAHNLAVYRLFLLRSPQAWKSLRSYADDEKATDLQARATSMIQIGWFLSDHKSAELMKRVVDPATAADAKALSQKYFATAAASPYNSTLGVAIETVRSLVRSNDDAKRKIGWETALATANAGSVQAMMLVAALLTTGLRPFVEPDFGAARATIRRIARVTGRNSDACMLLGDVAEAEENMADAFRWHSLSGWRNLHARYKVATYLSAGGFWNGTSNDMWSTDKKKRVWDREPPRDPFSAFKLHESLTKLTRAPQPVLQCAWGHLHGNGTELDQARGFTILLNHTTTGGEPAADVYRELAFCYSRGIGTKVDMEKALACLANVKTLTPAPVNGADDANAVLAQVAYAETQLRAKIELQRESIAFYDAQLAKVEEALKTYGPELKEEAKLLAAASGDEKKKPAAVLKPRDSKREEFQRSAAAAALATGKPYIFWGEDMCAGMFASGDYKIDRPSAFHNMHTVDVGDAKRATAFALLLERDAERGSPIAIANRGWLAWAHDKQMAIWCWEEAAKLGVITARVNLLACRIRELYEFAETYHASTKTKAEYFAELKELAETTQNRTALLNVAMCQYDGVGCDVDIDAAVKIIRAVAAVDDPFALVLLGGHLFETDKPAGVALWVRASKQNCTIATELVADLKLTELAELRESAKAMAEAGEGGAGDALTLREMRAKALALTDEVQQMIDKWAETDSKDSACVMWCQARLYASHDPPNVEKAFDLQLACAHLGHAAAMTEVGILHINESANAEDPDGAYTIGLEWLQRAWATGLEAAGVELATALLRRADELIQSSKLPEAKDGAAHSAEALAAAAERKAEADRYAARAMEECINPLLEKGNANAMVTMASCMWDGTGVPIDWDGAVAMFERAIEAGTTNPDAEELLAQARAAVVEQRAAADAAAEFDPGFARPGAARGGRGGNGRAAAGRGGRNAARAIAAGAADGLAPAAVNRGARAAVADNAAGEERGGDEAPATGVEAAGRRRRDPRA